MQQGQVFELKKRAVDGSPVWAYRYRTDGVRDGGSGEAIPPCVTRRKPSSGRSNISAGRRASAAR